MIVEDEENISELLRINLSLSSFEVVVAVDGESGLKMVYDLRPDLVLLDIRLDGMSGLDICRIVRKDPTFKKMYIIALSAATQEEEIKEIIAAGANEFISKPFDLGMLIKRTLSFQ